MNDSINKPKLLVIILPYLLLFLFGTFYLFHFTSYIFYSQEKSSLFLLTFSYLQEHLNQPGVFLIYLGELQKAFYYYSLLGSVLVALEICIIIFILQKIGFVLTRYSYYLIPFLVGGTLFYLQTDYQYQTFNNLGFLVQLLLFLWFTKTSKEFFKWLQVILFPAYYFLFGGYAVLLLGLVSIYFIQNRQWLKLLIGWVLVIIFFFIGEEFLFFQTTESLVRYPYSPEQIGGQIKMFLAVVGLVVIFPLLIRIQLGKLSTQQIRKVEVNAFFPFVVLIGLALIVMPRIDKKKLHYFHVEKLFHQQKYSELIDYNLRFPTTNSLTAFLTNVALAETGQLSTSLLLFPQSAGGNSLFLKWEMVNNVLERGGYFYYAVGMINEAQRWAYEYMVMKGNSPEVMKILIKTELIKGNYKVAEKYISMLESSLFYRSEAKAFRALLYNDKAIIVHHELGKKKAQDTKSDFFVQSDNPLLNLDYIIETDSLNIPALEYKLAWLMLRKDVPALVAMLPAMEKAGYKKIPAHVEEAVASYTMLKLGELPETKYLAVSENTKKQFGEFYRIFVENSSDQQRAQKALARYSNTYWYYVFFK